MSIGAALTNIAICGLIGFVCWITGSLWGLLGLLVVAGVTEEDLKNNRRE